MAEKQNWLDLGLCLLEGPAFDLCYKLTVLPIRICQIQVYLKHLVALVPLMFSNWPCLSVHSESVFLLNPCGCTGASVSLSSYAGPIL